VREETQLAAHELERSGTGRFLLPRHEQGADAALPEHGDAGYGGSDDLRRNGDVHEKNTARGARVHENGGERWPVPTASLLARPRPEEKRIGTATAIPGFPLRFLAQRGGVGHGEDAGGQGFGGGALYRRRGASATSAMVRVQWKKSERGSEGRK